MCVEIENLTKAKFQVLQSRYLHELLTKFNKNFIILISNGQVMIGHPRMEPGKLVSTTSIDQQTLNL